MLAKAVFVLFFLMGASAYACVQLESEYCCGYSLGDIYSCGEQISVKQTPIEGGYKFEFTGNGFLQGVFLADGKPYQVDNGLISGEAVTTCSDTGMVMSIDKAKMENDGTVAYGYYRFGFSTYGYNDGSFNKVEDCSFTMPDGTPAATSCGGGGGIYWESCMPKSKIPPPKPRG